ncbi:GntR family transcriptional regulator [Siminovitchia terrae]|uniref:GntR family transcriptional regulator n=1 Tax=Siminovitchia terrae TaxID=1914933 RepID=A0ABQ4KUG0_SIMTE|nr:GntR family transcriptional regulator [Siminovitchia terrae]GIN91588.1 GntR family transcriptional regulator [Siminovitchia terrae]GIN95678.1 GntR family transcriptional regulator [Siminovitchia terrae]
MLDKNKSSPLYKQLKNIIKDKIESGEWETDKQLPSERELVEQYKVSRITVRQAIDLAEREGLVKRVHGVGTFVAQSKIKQELTEFNTFQSTLQQLGLLASTKLLKSSVETSNFQLAKLLDIGVMDKVIHLELIGYGDSDPIVYYSSYFSFDFGKKMQSVAEKALNDNIPFSTLDLYTNNNNLGFQPTHVEQTFEAMAADENLSKILNVDLHFPLFHVTSVVYYDKLPLEYKETFYRGDKYKFFITRQM